MHSKDELDRIARDQDRSATFELIRELTETADDSVADALWRVGDPRAVPALTAIGRDRTRPDTVRQAAFLVLSEAASVPGSGELRDWWASGDDLVRAFIIREATRDETDLIEPVARDPNHVLHRDAIIGLQFGFEEPHWQEYKIAGLAHPDPAVRRTAADSLLWDEPVAAEPGLHRAAADDDEAVACAAIDTLRYYPSRATLRSLDEIGQGEGERAVMARDAKDYLLADFESERSSLAGWIEPVADLLGNEDVEPDPWSPGPPPIKPSAPPAPEVIDLFSDPDGSWAPKFAMLRDRDWSGVRASDRPGLAAYLAAHPDSVVRAECCAALANWHATDRLLELARDQNAGVRKSAVYYLRYVPAAREVAAFTWDLVESGAVAGTAGYEALATCAAHTPPGALDERLVALARTDLREAIRLEAIKQLGDRIEPLLHLLAEPPLLTWGVHVLLVEACGKAGLQIPGRRQLRDVDNLHLAAALGR
ncbi:HEAT repeat domain-containing protein [Nocardia sp. NPDC003693]